MSKIKEIIEMNRNYYLQWWGEVTNDGWLEQETGLKATEAWFTTPQQRMRMKSDLMAVAAKGGKTIVFSEYEGPDVHKETIAKMIMVLPDGRKIPYEHNFGFGYPIDAAEFMWTEGNYACDCNRSIFLNDEKLGELDCGDKIELEDFRVVQE